MADTKITIEFDLDQFNFDDFNNVGWQEDLQEGKIKPIRQLIEAYAVVEGLPPGMTLTDYLRSLKLEELAELANQLTQIVSERRNPARNGKNSNGGSLPISSRKRVSRR